MAELVDGRSLGKTPMRRSSDQTRGGEEEGDLVHLSTKLRDDGGGSVKGFYNIL